MRLIDLLDRETAPFHAEMDGELLGQPVSPRRYQRYLARMYGFVAPIERSITTTPSIERYADLRRFTKQDLLRRDLLALRFTSHQIDQLAQCAVPMFNTPAEALGWAYIIERSTLSHLSLFRHVATCIPGEVAFASSYLKCYFGSVGDMWRAYSESLDRLANDGETETSEAVEAAKAAFMFYQRWKEPERTERTERAASSASGGFSRAQLEDPRSDDDTVH